MLNPALCLRVGVQECGELLNATRSAMRNLFHQGSLTSLAPASSATRLGLKASLLFHSGLGTTSVCVVLGVLCRLFPIERSPPPLLPPLH